MDDLDLNLDDFAQRVNSDLVGKFVNIASRAAGFITKFFDGALKEVSPRNEEITPRVTALVSADSVRRDYAARDFNAVLREAIRLADLVNARWDSMKPWLLAKDASQHSLLHEVCTDCLLAFRILAIYLAPILPATARRVGQLFDESTGWKFDSIFDAPNRIVPYEHLLTRIDPKQIEAMVEASKESLQPAAEATATPAKSESDKAKADKAKKPAVEAPAKDSSAATGLIGIDDFAKLDLRIGTVLACGFVDGSDKLLRFELDAGELGTRQIFSGIRASYGEPETLVGRKVVFIANLAPRKMRFGISEGMILSAGFDGGDLFLLDADGGAASGMPVR